MQTIVAIQHGCEGTTTLGHSSKPVHSRRGRRCQESPQASSVSAYWTACSNVVALPAAYSAVKGWFPHGGTHQVDAKNP